MALELRAETNGNQELSTKYVGHRHRSYRIKARIDAWLMFLRCVEQVPML